VVLDHVARSADAVVVPGPAADADVLGHRDLHVVDVVAIPDRLVQLVGEAQRQDVLHRLLAQVVIDAEDRIRRERRAQRVVELPRRGKVMTERLLDDHPAPAVRLVGGVVDQTGVAQLLGHDGEVLRRDRQVVGVVAHRAAFDVQLVDGLAKTAERVGVGELAADETDAFQQLLPRLLAVLGAGVRLDRLVHHLGEVLVVPVASGEPDESEPRRQQAAVGQVVDGRHELLAGQVAGDTEDHQGAGPCDPVQTAVIRVAEGIVPARDLDGHACGRLTVQPRRA
jgi:hypothetical protein